MMMDSRAPGRNGLSSGWGRMAGVLGELLPVSTSKMILPLHHLPMSTSDLPSLFPCLTLITPTPSQHSRLPAIDKAGVLIIQSIRRGLDGLGLLWMGICVG